MRLFTAFSIAVTLATAGLSAEQIAPKAKNPVATPRQAGGPEKNLMGTLGIDGSPSTLVACVGGKFYNTHALGFATAGTRIRVDTTSADVDPTAMLIMMRMGGHDPQGQSSASSVYDDDSGGGNDPRLDATLPFDGNVVLIVGSYDGTFGCYWIKVTATPAP